MEMEHATIITNGSSNHENRRQEVGRKMRSLSKADRPYYLYCIVDALIMLAIACLYSIQLFSGYFDGKADERRKLLVVFYLAAINMWFGVSDTLEDKNGYYLLTYTVRLSLLATFTAQCSLFSSKTDIDVQGPFMTVLYSCLSLFYAFGVPLFLYKTIAISLDMGRAVKKGEWEVVPAHMVVLILCNILDLLATTCLSVFYLVWSITEYGVGSGLVLPLILFGLTSATWTFGLYGLVCKDDVALTIYCIRLLPLLIVPLMGAIACFFLPISSTVMEIFLLCWVFMVPFYAIMLTLFTDKTIALNSDRTRVVMEEEQGEADMLVDVPGLG